MFFRDCEPYYGGETIPLFYGCLWPDLEFLR